MRHTHTISIQIELHTYTPAMLGDLNLGTQVSSGNTLSNNFIMRRQKQKYHRVGSIYYSSNSSRGAQTRLEKNKWGNESQEPVYLESAVVWSREKLPVSPGRGEGGAFRRASRQDVVRNAMRFSCMHAQIRQVMQKPRTEM